MASSQGFGVDTGLFTTFIYLVAVPAMLLHISVRARSAFGFGTLIVLLAIGSVLAASPDRKEMGSRTSPALWHKSGRHAAYFTWE